MKKILLYFITVSFVFVSCITKDIPGDESGLLEINPITIDTGVEVSPLSRTVDDRLQVDIYSASTIVKTFKPGDIALDSPIKLPVGNYKLIAHSPDMAEAENNVVGIPLYSVSYDFIIEKEQTTTISSLIATQSNVGVAVSLANELFNIAFKSIECVVFSSSGRSVVIDAKQQSHSKVYFNVSEGTVISYQINSMNNDGESFSSEIEQLPLGDGIKDYTITITF